MDVRKAVISDLPKLAQLFDQYRVWYRKTADIESAKDFLKQRIQKGDSVIYIAVSKDGSLTGFTQCYPLFSSTRMKRLWLLNDLFVHPNYRGQGVSKQLINAAKELCRQTDACALTLETEKSNTIGNHLYPKMGFELNEAHHFYEWTVK